MFKGLPEASEEAKRIIFDIQETMSQGFVPSFGDDFAGEMEIVDQSLIDFLKTSETSSISLENYQKYLKQTSSATSAFSTITAGAGKVMKIFAATAVNALASIVVAKIINEVIEAYDNWVHRIDNAKDAMEKSKESYGEVSSELEELRKQSHEAQAKMKQMERTGLVGDDEYKKLQETNAELEREIKLLEARQKVLATEVWNTSEDWYDKTRQHSASGADTSYNEKSVLNQTNASYNNSYLYDDGMIENNKDNINFLLGAYKGLSKLQDDNIAKIEAETNALDGKDEAASKVALDTIQGYESQNEVLDTNIANIQTYLDEYRSGLDDLVTAYEQKEQLGSYISSDDTAKYNEAIALIRIIDELLIGSSNNADQASESFSNAADAINRFEISDSTKAEALTKINALKDGFDSLKDLYNSISEDKALDFSIIDEDFEQIFSGAEAYQDFIDVITDSPDDIKGCQEAFDNLIYSWLNTKDFMSVLNDETVVMVGAFLEEQGVVDATSWLMAELAARKEMVSGKTADLSEATKEEVEKFYEEYDAAENVKQALARLQLAKITLNGTVIDTSGDIDNLIALAEQAGATAEMLAATKNYNKVLEGYNTTVGDDILESDYLDAQKKAKAELRSVIDYKPGEGKGSSGNNSTTNTYNPPSSSSKSSGSSSSNKKEEIDWIETKITRCNEQIEKLETKLADLPTRLQKNPHINTIIDEETEKLNILQQAYNEYMKSASESADKNGLKHEYVMKVQNGTIDIEQISDDSIKNAISEYQDLYNKALAANVEITATATKIKELKVQKLDNITNDYDNITSLIDSIYNYREGLINLKEKAGEEILEEDYTNLISYQNSIYEANKREYEELLSEFNQLVDDGTISKYSDQWFDYTQQLHETNAELTESQEAIEDLRDSIIELRLKPLQDYKDSLDSINGSYETLLSLIGDEDLMNGSMITDRGLAQLAIYGQQLGMAKQEVEEYSNAIKSVSAMYENGTITVDEYNERIYDLRNAHESAISSVQKAREAILQFRYDAIQGQIEDMQELTQSRIDDLNQMKENEDYAKKISDKQKNISTLEKKIAVLSLSTNRADIAMRLQLEQELADAREE